MTLHELDSHPIGDELGLQTQDVGTAFDDLEDVDETGAQRAELIGDGDAALLEFRSRGVERQAHHPQPELDEARQRGEARIAADRVEQRSQHGWLLGCHAQTMQPTQGP